MKRRLKENIEIGDEVYAPRDEYKGTVVDINGDEVLVDGPFGEEYHNLSDLEKLGDDYEEDLPFPFRENFTESKRKKVIRLTESDLARIVKRVISESKKNPSKSEILKMTKEELKDVYGKLEVKGEYLNPKNKGTFHNFKRTAIGDVVCSFRTDDTTPSGLKRNTQGIKVKMNDVKFN
jgi:hypothetical protein